MSGVSFFGVGDSQVEVRFSVYDQPLCGAEFDRAATAVIVVGRQILEGGDGMKLCTSLGADCRYKNAVFQTEPIDLGLNAGENVFSFGEMHDDCSSCFFGGKCTHGMSS